MLHVAFAVATGAKKVYRLLNLQNFLTGSMQRVNSMLRINSSQCICWALALSDGMGTV